MAKKPDEKRQIEAPIVVPYTELEKEKLRRIGAELRLLELQYQELLRERDGVLEGVKARAEVPDGKAVDWGRVTWGTDTLTIPPEALREDSQG